MALKGTLKDFSMADIFQLISLQRKSGILRVKSAEELITVSFLNGYIVWADTSQRELEERLGQVLIKNGKISTRQLEKALAIQRKTLQRLGHIMVSEGFIKRDELREALTRQVKMIAYRIFLWKDGDYDFDQDERLEYDRENFSPISAESIMMECARMSDELQMIERKIKSKDMIFEKVLREDVVAMENSESILNEDIDFGFGKEGETSRIKLSPSEALIYNFLDGRSSVEEIAIKSDLGEFETSRILYELLNRNLIKVAEAQSEREKSTAGTKIEGGTNWLFLFALVFMTVISIIFIPLVSPGKNILTSGNLYHHEILKYTSKTKLGTIDKALKIYYFNKRKFPAELEELVRAGYLRESHLMDPWGNSYRYVLFDDAYRLWGLNGSGEPDEDLMIINNFSSIQKVIIQSFREEGEIGT
ncbi:MAG: DUF4388 domain-containing protein [Acidobacteriota bacterium]